MAQFMKCLWLVCMAAVLPVSMNANASPQRIACNNFAELSVAVFQIRQDGNEVENVLEYANNNLKSAYPDHIFTLVTEMIKAAYKRPLISDSELQLEAINFASEQKGVCNESYAQIDKN